MPRSEVLHDHQKPFAAAQSTAYPYWRVGGQSVFDRLRSAVAPFNPFAQPMVPTHNRVSYTPREGKGYYAPTPYPTAVTFTNLMPVHYDPLTASGTSAPHERHQHHHGPSGLIQAVRTPFPLGCVRAKQRFEQCAMVNGKSACGEEGQNVLAICPNHVLHEMHKQKLEEEVAKQVQMRELERALRVSDYNNGRSVTEVDPQKRFRDGTRQVLRPDSLWADDRYADVTVEEINAAKQRLAGRRQAHPRQHFAADIAFPNPKVAV